MRRWLWVVVCVFVCAVQASAQTITYYQQIAPIIKQHCVSCHFNLCLSHPKSGACPISSPQKAQVTVSSVSFSITISNIMPKRATVLLPHTLGSGILCSIMLYMNKETMY